MIRYLLFVLFIVAVLISIVFLIIKSPGNATITLNEWSVEMNTPMLLISLIAGYFALNLFFGLLRYVFSIRSRFDKMNNKRLSNKASKELIQGFLLLSEGHWNKAEKILLKNAQHNDTPVINYLAAARAAHLQEDTEKRDALLKEAIDLDDKADIVVSVTQAEMQIDSQQVAQAQATLLRVQDMSPNHPYISKLLAKAYYKQKNWTALFDLIPALLKQKAIKDEDITKFKIAAIEGLFKQYAEAGEINNIQKAWKKLPSTIRKYSDAVLIYADALNNAGDSQLAGNALVSQINDDWDERLVELYGKLVHGDAISAGEKAKKWLESHTENPSLLLTLARLNVQKKLWGKAKSFYESSLNMKPNSAAYLELAQLLQQIGEQENANTCYRIGLQYCFEKKAERLTLKSDATDGRAGVPTSQPITEEFYTV